MSQQETTNEVNMKVKGNERLFAQEEELLDNRHTHISDYDYEGGVQKIKTAIGKIRKLEDSQYKHHDSKRFKKHK